MNTTAPLDSAPESLVPSPAFPRWLWQPNAIVFVSSLCTMVLELVASRIVAPYVGVSLYTWTSVIGVVLAGISLGNYLGGRLADRWGSPRLLGLIFLLGGLTSVGVLAVDTLGPRVPALGSIVVQIVALTAALFFIPCAVLGCVSPIVAKLAVRDLARTGSTVGKIYAFSTAGSIFGTFAAGFWLISAFGTHTIIWGVAMVLLFLGLVCIIFGSRPAGRASRPVSLALAFLVVASFSQGASQFGWLRSQCARETNYFCIKVYDEERDGRTVRVLVLDRLVHSYTDLADPTRLVYGYEQVYAELTAYRSQSLNHDLGEQVSGENGASRSTPCTLPDPGMGNRDGTAPLLPCTPAPVRALFIGGGGYTFPRYIETLFPGSAVRVVEIDPGVTQVAYDFLGLSRQTSIVTTNEDARLFFEGTPDHGYDLIVGDAFNDFSVPYHLTTREFNDQVHRWLAPGGFYMVNLIDGPRHDFLRSYVHTLSRSFRTVYVVPSAAGWRDSPRMTFVVIGVDAPIDQGALAASLPTGHSVFVDQALKPEEVAALLAESRPVVLTDQYAPVDQLLAPVFRGESAR